MASKTFYLSGTAKWAKVHEPDKKYNVYKMDLELDDASLLKFNDSGMQLKVKDGRTISLRRTPAVLIKGELKEFGKPDVLDSEGKATSVLIGNGSKVTCKVTTYDTVKGKGHRLEAVRIDELVAYGDESESAPDSGVPF